MVKNVDIMGIFKASNTNIAHFIKVLGFYPKKRVNKISL